MTKAILAIRTRTREGFRLLVAWFLGVLSFGLLTSLTERILLYASPGKAENTAHSDAELVLLLFLIGLGIFALAAALIREGLSRIRAQA